MMELNSPYHYVYMKSKAAFKTATLLTITHLAFMLNYTVYRYNSTTLLLKFFFYTQWQLNHQWKLQFFHESKINHLATDVLYLTRQIERLHI